MIGRSSSFKTVVTDVLRTRFVDVYILKNIHSFRSCQYLCSDGPRNCTCVMKLTVVSLVSQVVTLRLHFLVRSDFTIKYFTIISLFVNVERRKSVNFVTNLVFLNRATPTSNEQKTIKLLPL